MQRATISETKKYFKEGKFGIWVPPKHVKEKVRRREQWVLKQFNWKNKLVLDIGVGAGRFSIPTAEKDAEVIALDIYPKTVHLTKEIVTKRHLNNKISFLIVDAEKLPFKDEVFDIIICMQTFMHLPNPQIASLEMWRTLKKGKFAIVQTNNKFSLGNVNLYFRYNLGPKIYHFFTRRALQKQTPHYWTCSLPTFKNYFLKCGFKILKFKSYNPFSFTLLAIVQK